MRINWTGAVAALAVAGGVLTLGAPARAQFFGGFGYQPFEYRYNDNDGDSLSPGEIRASLADRGYRLVGPPRRNRDVYVADVVDRQGRNLRVIVDRYDGQVLQRFLKTGPQTAARTPPPAAADGDDDTAPTQHKPVAKPKTPPRVEKPAPGIAARPPAQKPTIVAPRPAPSTAGTTPPVSRPTPPPVASVPAPPPAVAAAPVESPPATLPVAPQGGPVVNGVPNAPLD